MRRRSSSSVGGRHHRRDHRRHLAPRSVRPDEAGRTGRVTARSACSAPATQPSYCGEEGVDLARPHRRAPPAPSRRRGPRAGRLGLEHLVDLRPRRRRRAGPGRSRAARRTRRSSPGCSVSSSPRALSTGIWPTSAIASWASFDSRKRMNSVAAGLVLRGLVSTTDSPPTTDMLPPGAGGYQRGLQLEVGVLVGEDREHPRPVEDRGVAARGQALRRRRAALVAEDDVGDRPLVVAGRRAAARPRRSRGC